MKKPIILLLCCGVLVSMVGCGGNTAPPPTDSPPITVSETVITETTTETPPPITVVEPTEKEKEPVLTESKVQATEPTVTTTEHTTMATPTKETKTTVTSTAEEKVALFDIDYWITYAKNYAESKGLTLSDTAVDCWDNPIRAGVHCIYLERDIQSRLNRYARDEDITDVWIRAESTSDDCYDIYIGYA